MTKKVLRLNFSPYNLQLTHSFNLANSSRKSTPVMLTTIDYDGYTGYGEAAMPPYLGESQKTAANFLSKVKLNKFSNPFLIDDILTYVDNIDEGNNAAKASIDIALHDLVGKLMGYPWYKIWGYTANDTPNTSFTIGIDTTAMIQKKVKEATPYKILKVKLGSNNDKNIIETIRAITNKPICVDVNQGWNDKNKALEMLHWLYDKRIIFTEQPLPKENIDDNAWLTENSPMPIIADEAILRLKDIKNIIGVYSGINIKLMKCTGLREAHKMIEVAKYNNLKIMIGCMTETSCAISAAAQLSPKAKWADLDGNLLINNDPFEGMKINNGKIILPNTPGIGAFRNYKYY